MGLKLTVGVRAMKKPPATRFAEARYALRVFCAAKRTVVGAQFIAPFPPRLQLSLRLSPVTSHESLVTDLTLRVTAS